MPKRKRKLPLAVGRKVIRDLIEELGRRGFVMAMLECVEEDRAKLPVGIIDLQMEKFRRRCIGWLDRL